MEPYAQRTTDIAVVETGLKVSVPTTILMSPTIYGLGSGFFNRLSIQIPTLIRAAIAQGHAAVIGTGAGRWDAVHISDLVLLYEIVLAKILGDDSTVPQGEMGILFSEALEFTWRELAEDVAKAGEKLGALKSDKVQEISLEQGARLWSGGDLQLAELGFASKSVCFRGMFRQVSTDACFAVQERDLRLVESWGGNHRNQRRILRHMSRKSSGSSSTTRKKMSGRTDNERGNRNKALASNERKLKERAHRYHITQERDEQCNSVGWISSQICQTVTYSLQNASRNSQA